MPGAAARIRLRTREGWSRWRTLHGCAGGRDGRPALAGGNAVLVTHGAVGYEVSVAGQGAAEVVELNTVDGPTIATRRAPVVFRTLPLPHDVTVPVPYLPRAAWGADESLRFANGAEKWPTDYYPTQMLTVHHSADANGDRDPAATVRGIYYHHCVTQGWGDIGYNLLIDEAGRVYEGRWSGTDGIPAFQNSAGTMMAGAAHAQGFNPGNIGVCLLGHLNEQQPTAAARRSLILVLAGIAQVCGLDPRGTVNYVNPVNGNARTVATISGHRDWNATDCPGHAFYPQLPDLREAVAAVPPMRPRQ